MLQAQNLTKQYRLGRKEIVLALDHVSFTLPETGMVFLLGKSGSGKTTMLNLMGGLDAPTEGELCIDGTSSKHFRQKDWDAYRNNYVGFVFQEYNLLDDLTIGANIALALNLQGKISKADAKQKISAALEQVGLSGYGDRKPGELSGGQKQRIAIARALVKNPQMILADEPTGALDSENGTQILDLLKAISREKLVVVVSHDEESARRYADRIIELADGKVIADTAPTCRDIPVTPTRVTTNKRSHSARSIMSLGARWVFTRKLHLSITAILCAAAMALVGTADVIASYSQRETLVRSLFAAKQNYMTVTKEWYNDYDYTSTSLMLPTEESVQRLVDSGLQVTPGKAGWYEGYMLLEEDIADLIKRTGKTFKGVYVPHNIPLSLSAHYLSYRGAYVIPKDKVVTSLQGFMELTEADLTAFDLSLVAGRLPNGDVNEIAISKYVYDSFARTGYYGFDYNVKFVIHCGEVDEIYVMPWEKLLHDGYLEFEKKLASIKKEYASKGVTYIWWEVAGALCAEDSIVSVDIKQPEDLIGKTLFIENRNYTITGIVDTGFTESDRQAREHELTFGMAGLAFVGEGRIREIASRYPVTLSVEDMAMKVPISDPLDSKVIHDTLSFNTFTKLSTVPKFQGGNLATLDTNQGKMFFMDHATRKTETFKFYADYKNLDPGKFDFLDLANGTQWFKFSAVHGSESAYGDYGWQVGQWMYTTENAIYYDLYQRSGNINLQQCTDSVILEDFYFDILTEGRGGLYHHAIGAMPAEEKAIAAFLDRCEAEQDNTRYHFENLIAYEVVYLHNTISEIQAISKQAALAMMVFATLVFAVFLSISMNGKRREIGILRALGATGKNVLLIFSIESLVLWGICSVFSIGLSAVAIHYLNKTLQEMLAVRSVFFEFNIRQIFLMIATGFIIAMIASAIPILRIARQKPVDAIRE